MPNIRHSGFRRNDGGEGRVSPAPRGKCPKDKGGPLVGVLCITTVIPTHAPPVIPADAGMTGGRG